MDCKDCEKQKTLCKEQKVSCILSRNPQITQLFELCVKPESENAMKRILKNFWLFDECVNENKKFSQLDIFSIYVLDFVYGEKEVSLTSLARCLYIYLKQINLPYFELNRDALINSSERSFMMELQEITDFDSFEGENILVDAIIKSVYGTNLGLIQFLLKFGLVKFPTEENETGKSVIKKLVSWFNVVCKLGDAVNVRSDIVVSEDFLQEVKLSEISFRRSILMFFGVCIIFEYHAFEKLEVNSTTVTKKNLFHLRKSLCFGKFLCLDAFMDATDEPFLTVGDIEKFQKTFKNFLRNVENVTSFKELSEIFFYEALKTGNNKTLKHGLEPNTPRSLKNLARVEIRGRLQNLPDIVDELEMPDDLKNYLLFNDKDGIWQILKTKQLVLYLENEMSRCRRN